MSSIFSLQDISKNAGDKSILHKINIDIYEREFFCIVGPSGSGKTTLLRLLNGLESAGHGLVKYKGQPLLNGDIRKLRREIGFVFQNPVVFADSVRGNLLIRKEWDKEFSVSKENLASVLLQAGLNQEHLNMDARSLSGGEKQRLSLARVLLNQPEVLLLDEPTANLDHQLSGHIMNTIRSLQKERSLTVVLVSHNIEQVKALSDRVAFLIGGSIVEVGSTDILTNPTTQKVMSFLKNKSS